MNLSTPMALALLILLPTLAIAAPVQAQTPFTIATAELASGWGIPNVRVRDGAVSQAPLQFQGGDLKYRGEVVAASSPPPPLDYEIIVREILQDPTGLLRSGGNTLVTVYGQGKVIGNVQVGSYVEVYAEYRTSLLGQIQLDAFHSIHYIKTGGGPECTDGEVKLLETCPDGSWKRWQVCAMGRWTYLTQDCQVCKAGDVKVLETCPDGSWKHRQVCRNNQWVDEYQTCPPVCSEGAVRNVVMCPDGVNWKQREVCRNNAWVPESKTCPLVCSEGVVRNEVKCPDGVNWKQREVCRNNAWVPESKTCPLGQPKPPNLMLLATRLEGLTVRLSGVVEPGTSGTTIQRIRWNWGDGSSGDYWFPASHTYGSGGIYVVTVTVYQSDGLSTMKVFPVSPEPGLVKVQLHDMDRFWDVKEDSGWCGPKAITTVVNYMKGHEAITQLDVIRFVNGLHPWYDPCSPRYCSMDNEDIRKALNHFLGSNSAVISDGLGQEAVVKAIETDRPAIIHTPGHYTVAYSYVIGPGGFGVEVYDMDDVQWQSCVGPLCWIINVVSP